MLRVEIENQVEKAWDNGIVDYANRKSAKERELALAFTLGKIEGNIPSIAQEILSLFKQEIEKLGVISDEEIRLSCLGEGSYYAGERDETATTSPPVLMPQFRRVIKAQVQDCKDTLLRMME